ncbi:MAG: cellulase family glycosylhydrolase [Bacteroidota bacterium]|nr:cellulase family glycosylhydrolase [Bacteroidota bacterium]
MKKTLFLLFSFFLLISASAQTAWPVAKAKAWYAKQRWPVGCNFSPSTAINQLEMWQADTFDTLTINKELGWAQGLGMTTVRVFLHDIAYDEDNAGFLQRMATFLQISSRHKIKPLFVFFDSVWDPFPAAGKQRDPKPFVHNSGWVQSPGANALTDEKSYHRLEKYVKDVVHHFKADNRIFGWDVWNEPDNINGGEYNKQEPKNKQAIVLVLLQRTFDWARSQKPIQPLTSGVWYGNWSSNDSLKPIWKVQLNNSDIISFHNYDDSKEFDKRIKWLQRYNRPIICTEYMARGHGSFFKPNLEIAKRYNVGMYNWGFVSGKTQTIYPWDSWDKQYTGEPDVWFHDIFRADGTPYKQEEVSYIRNLTGKTKKK